MLERSDTRGTRATVEVARVPGWAAVAVLAALLWVTLGLGMAQAAPSHTALPALDIEGLNHACGAAVDSEGDVYAASAGESKVYVFDPEHHQPGEQIAEISNAQEPCGLAVDSKGNLYVSQKANGQVVRYEPNAYPLTGTPSYGSPTVIDASGNAKGIAVDPFDDRLYVARGDRVVSYDAEGTLGIDEVQVLRVGNASGGTFRLALPGEGGGGRNEVQSFDTQFTSGTYTLTFEGETTGPLAAHASALAVEEALESLPGIGDGDVSVSGFPDLSKWVEFTGALANANVPLIVADDQGTPIVADGVTVSALSDISEPIAYEAPAVDVEAALEGLDGIGPGNVLVTVSGNRYVIAFAGALAHTDVPSLVADPSGLTLNGSGFSPEARLINEAGATQGWSGQVGLGDLGEATGVAAYTYRGDSSRYVFVADASTDEIKTFAGSDIRALSLRRVDDGSATPAGSFGFGAAGTALAADAANGHLFVYDSLHSVVDEIEASGRFLDQIASASFADAAPSGIAVLPQRSEVQKLTLSSISGGTFTLGFGGEQTAALPSNATAAQIAAALTALGSIGSGNVEVEADETFRIRFVEALAARNVAEIAVDDSGLSGAGTAVLDTLFPGYGPGRLYVGAGAGANARLLAFGPLAESSRALLDEPLSHVLPGARAVAVDSAGDVYVSDGAEVHVYGPEGNELTGFADSEHAKDLAVDSAGRVYVVDTGSDVDQQKVTYYTPSSYPPTPATTYSRHEPPIATRDSFPKGSGTLEGVAVDPADDHVFVAAQGALIELDSAAPGHESKTLDPSFGAGLGIGSIADIAVDGPSGNVYISSSPRVIRVLDPTGKKVLARINGYGSPRPIGASPAIAVDQASGHVLSFDNHPDGVAQEYEATGAPVVEFGEFGETALKFGIAIDSSGGPSDGTAYVAFDDQRPGTPDVWAFAPLAYGEAPKAVSGGASELTGGSARLNATVNPNGFELEECRFEYLSEAQYDGNGKTFAGASSVPCAESLAQIGRGTKAVAVHADVSGLDPEAAYRFRLVATNEYGTSEGDPSLFGPPLVTTGAAQPVFYGEATLRGEVDPSGLATSYRFQYGEAGGEYDHETAEVELPPGEEPVAVQAALTGLKEGTSYRFRLIAENEAKAVPGSERTFTTLVRRGEEACGNVEFRTGLSAKLSDCRAYELVSPAQTGGGKLGAPSPGSPQFGFNQWLTPPSGGSGMLSYEATTTLPGFEGTGFIDLYRAERAPGPHPPQGWRSEARSPTYAQVGGGGASSLGVASDQLYSFQTFTSPLQLEGALPSGEYLRTPAGFEVVGQGTLGTDLKARSQFVSAGGEHVVFTSKAKLEPDAAPEGTVSVYDRSAGAGAAQVLSLTPAGAGFGAGEDASYVAASEDGTAVIFKVGGDLYARAHGQTYEIAAAPAAFAGISEDDRYLFYATGTGTAPGNLFRFDLETESATEIAENAIFITVSPDGAQVFFSSATALTGAEENEAGQTAQAGQRNLFAWSGGETRFVAVLDPKDFLLGFGNESNQNLGTWSQGLTAETTYGRASTPARANPDGGVFVFQSHARLTEFENEGHGEIYRYAPAAPEGERLLCVSCDAGGAAPGADAMLEQIRIFFPSESIPPANGNGRTLIPNLTPDGERVFFQSRERLAPDDVNEVSDIYEWSANGAGGCKRPGGCLALISSGQGEENSRLYSMSSDGRDVFFTTTEKLVGADVPGSPSIYDARVEGGIPDPPAAAPCQGDACQGAGSVPPALRRPGSSELGEGGNLSGREGGARRCPKGRRAVVRAGKRRCLKAKHRHRARHGKRRAR